MFLLQSLTGYTNRDTNQRVPLYRFSFRFAYVIIVSQRYNSWNEWKRHTSATTILLNIHDHFITFNQRNTIAIFGQMYCECFPHLTFVIAQDLYLYFKFRNIFIKG